MVILFWTLVAAVSAGFGTWAAGWIAAAAVALLTAALAPRRSWPLLSVPVGVVLGWAVLLLRASRADGFGAFVDRLAIIATASPTTLVAATLVFGLTLGLGGALIGIAVRSDPVASDPTIVSQ